MATKKKSQSKNAGDDKKKALDAAMAMIEKDYGKGAVMRLGDDNRPPIKAISSGNTAIDVALGIGGFPRGRVVEIYGPESSGKTTVALHAIAEAQKEGGIAAFVDAEHALDPEYARLLGVDTDNLLVSQPDTGEQALEIADMLVRSGGTSKSSHKPHQIWRGSTPRSISSSGVPPRSARTCECEIHDP